jgi:putative inorganic carbon (HCO3(-)) transporter
LGVTIAAVYFTNAVQPLEWLLSDASMPMAGRVELWQRALYIMQDFPYTGLGPSTFPLVVPVWYPLFLIGPDVQPGHAHNLYLQTGVDLGVPGLVAFVALITTCLMMAGKVISQGPSKVSSIALGLLVGLQVYLIHGLTDYVGVSTKPGIVVWAIIGLIGALYRQCHRRDLS